MNLARSPRCCVHIAVGETDLVMRRRHGGGLVAYLIATLDLPDPPVRSGARQSIRFFIHNKKIRLTFLLCC